MQLEEDKNPRDINGRTPIHLAAARGHLEVVKFLVSMVNKTEKAFSLHGSHRSILENFIWKLMLMK